MMTVRDMVDELSLRLIDAAKGKFPDKFKWECLNLSQYYVVNMLNPSYLTELVVCDSNKTVTSGALALTGLTKKPLRGCEGIIDVQVYTGLYCNMIGLDDLKKEENSYLDGSTTYPMAWLFSNTIRTIPTTISAVNVDYMIIPPPLMHAFTFAGAGISAGNKFAIDASQNIVETDDFYNGAVIYIASATVDGAPLYEVVTDYTGITREMTVSQNQLTDYEAGTFYFIPTADHDFHLTNLENVYCTLDASLHELVIDIAEALCWKVPGDSLRVKEALDNALEQIKSLNSSVLVAEGIGTK